MKRAGWQGNNTMQPSTILFLAANPARVPLLQLGKECRAIEDRIRAAKFRDRLRFRSRWAACPDDLLQALNEDNPSVLHFSGHGAGAQGLCFQADDGSPCSVSAEALARVMRSAGASVAVVLLNACYSEVQAQALVASVPCVIGMSDAIGDEGAIMYAASFYRALAFGKSVANAHEQGIAALGLPSASGRSRDMALPESSQCGSGPRLLTRSDTDPGGIYVVHEHTDQMRCTIVIRATLRDFNAEVLARVTQELRHLTGDISLQIISLDEGSVRLTVTSSSAATRTIFRLRANGELARLGGFSVIGVLASQQAGAASSADRILAAGSQDRVAPYEPSVARETSSTGVTQHPGSARYRVVRQIGAGGMGVVYEADDLERGQKVALKTIPEPNVERIYQLKREFRALADLSHPNLVALYDLVIAEESCFFVMELLDGVDLLAYVRPHLDDDRRPQPVDAADETLGQHPPGPLRCDIERLRTVLPQLARGLHALHAFGKIHRDVKPSNIQITSEGRAVLLDFGLVAELEPRHTATSAAVGTVAYMAPEQCAGDVQLTAAADWYALGVVLFQALTGRLPFEGVPAGVMLEKQTEVAPRPSLLVQAVPPDLDDLCVALLERDPVDRPTGAQLLHLLGVAERDWTTTTLASNSRNAWFAGRDAELATLDAATEPLMAGDASVAVIRGCSGIGKTSLVVRFLERLRATHPDAVILHGRCLDREDVPYKAIDRLIDELSDWWRQLAPQDAEALLPRDAHLLPTLFPVLDRVPAIADAPRTRTLADPQARRTHAFDALRESLRRIGNRNTLVLFLDDMQWVDRDTTALLADLMRAPDPPSVLLLLATRTEGSEAVLDLVHRMDAAQCTVELGRLSEEAAVALAVSHLGDDDHETARHLVHEADGSPLFLIELARYMRGRTLDNIAGKGLDAMLVERIDGLGESARTIAELVAVAGEPITRTVLIQASTIPAAELSRQLSLLRAQHVVRMSGSRADDTIEPYHACVRSPVLGQLHSDRRERHHRTLATALSGKGSTEQLARHWYGAGDLENAARYARRAGDEARAKLAFDLSWRWYEMALEGPQWTDAERQILRTQLADTLADAGRPREAAEQFMLAAAGADTVATLELHRRGAGCLLQSGHVAEGLALIAAVLHGVGLAMPSTPLRSLLWMVARRAWLRMRGMSFRSRSVGELSQAELTRADVCESVALGLVLVDTFRSMDFSTRFLLAALRLGERRRVQRAMAHEINFLAATGKGRRAVWLLERFVQITATLNEPQADARLIGARGFITFFVHNRFRGALTSFSEALTSYRAVVGRAGIEVDTVSIYCCWSLYYLGEIRELSRRVPAMTEAAARSGNRYTAVTLRCAFPIAWLARLEPDAIEAELDSALGSWTSAESSYQLQHLFAFSSRIDLALYRGRPESVTSLIGPEWKRIRRSLIDRPPFQGLMLRSTLLRHAVACANHAGPNSSRRREALLEARHQLRRLPHRKAPLVGCSATMFEGLILEAEGRTDEALKLYRAALPGLVATETHLLERAVQFRIGCLIGGSEGAALHRGVRDWLEGEGVRAPDAMLDMLLPSPLRV